MDKKIIKEQKNKGITLIALVITIIILLILASVAINSLEEDNGIIKGTETGSETSRGANVKEIVGLTTLNNSMLQFTDEYKEDDRKTKSELVLELEKSGQLTEEEIEQLDENNKIIIENVEVDFSKINKRYISDDLVTTTIDDMVDKITKATTPITIYLADGTYALPELIIEADKDITIVSVSGDRNNVIFDGQIEVNGKLTIKDMTLINQNVTSRTEYTKNNVTVFYSGKFICDNIKFENVTSNSSVIRTWWNQDDAEVIVKNSLFNCNGNRAIQLTINGTIENCKFKDQYRYSIQVDSSSNKVINFKNNKIVNAGVTSNKLVGYGIQVASSYGVTNLTVNGEGNIIKDKRAADAIYVYETGVSLDELTLNATDQAEWVFVE